MKENESTFICTHILHIYTSKTDRLSDRVEDWSTKWWKTCQCDDVVLVVDAIMLCVSVLDLLVYFCFHISFFCWQIHFGTDWKSGLLAVNAVSDVHHARPSTKNKSDVSIFHSFMKTWRCICHQRYRRIVCSAYSSNHKSLAKRRLPSMHHISTANELIWVAAQVQHRKRCRASWLCALGSHTLYTTIILFKYLY